MELSNFQYFSNPPANRQNPPFILLFSREFLGQSIQGIINDPFELHNNFCGWRPLCVGSTSKYLLSRSHQFLCPSYSCKRQCSEVVISHNNTLSTTFRPILAFSLLKGLRKDPGGIILRCARIRNCSYRL